MSRSSARRARGDRGAVLVEAGLALPVFFLLVFGIMEAGHALKSYSAVANAARGGGRAASVAGAEGLADQEVLLQIQREAAGTLRGEIQYVIIWKATPPTYGAPLVMSPPQACINVAESLTEPNLGPRGVSGVCNIYAHPDAPNGAFALAADEANLSQHFDCDLSNPIQLDCSWPPRSREVRISPRGEFPRYDPDHVGVYLKAKHRYLTGVMGSTLTITESGVNMIEPDAFAMP